MKSYKVESILKSIPETRNDNQLFEKRMLTFLGGLDKDAVDQAYKKMGCTLASANRIRASMQNKKDSPYAPSERIQKERHIKDMNTREVLRAETENITYKPVNIKVNEIKKGFEVVTVGGKKPWYKILFKKILGEK